jgi:HEPN domain-containing protein
MREREGVLLETVRQWARKGDNDLKVAAHALKLGKECPTDTVSFHAQQCVEKYQKALLVLHLIDFPKTHDLNALARSLPGPLLPLLSDQDRRRMTEYATVIRYPGDYLEIPLAEARHAVALARRVRTAIRKLLPKSRPRR